MSGEELFETVDEAGNVTGHGARSECHGNPALIHRCAHVVVYHPDGRILLQKRSDDKDIQRASGTRRSADTWQSAKTSNQERGEK
jgi:isopentenyldiphosphate isomerase